AQRAIGLINQSQIYRLLRKPVSEQLLRGTVNLASQRFSTLLKHPELVRRNEAEQPAEPAARAASGGMPPMPRAAPARNTTPFRSAEFLVAVALLAVCLAVGGAYWLLASRDSTE